MKESKLLGAYFLPNTFVIEEMVEPITEAMKIWIEAFETDKYSALYHLGFLNRENWFSPSLDFLHHIAEMLIKKISQQSDIEFSRETVEIYLPEEVLEKLRQEIPFVIGSEYVDDEWIQSTWEAMLVVFKTEIKSYEGTVARYFAEHNSNINVVGRVFFHLVENKDSQFPFAFMATYSTKPVKSKRAVHTPLKNALAEFEGDEKKLLTLISTVIKAAEKSVFISELLESGELFSPLKLTTEEAYIVLKEMELYEDVGIMCRVPDWWRKRKNSVKLSVAVGEKAPSKVGLDAILDFYPTIKIGENDITEKELKAFLDMAEGLVQYKGKWVEIDKKKMEAVLLAFDKVKNQTQGDALSLADVLRFELSQDELAQIGSDYIELSMSNGQWLKTFERKFDSSRAYRKSRLSTFISC